MHGPSPHAAVRKSTPCNTPACGTFSVQHWAVEAGEPAAARELVRSRKR